MKKYNILTLLFTGIAFVGTGFLAGWLTSTVMPEQLPPNQTPIQVMDVKPIQEDVPIITPEPTILETSDEKKYYGVYYELKLENDELYFYEVDSEHRNLLRKCKITVNTFPASDIVDLKNGIKTSTKEDGLKILEDFIS